MNTINLLKIDDKLFPELTNTNFFEQVDLVMAKKFLNIKWRKLNKIVLEPKDITYLRKYIELYGTNSKTIISYKYSKKVNDSGRIYPEAQGLTLLSKVIRNNIIDYLDLDIRSAHPTFCYNLGKIYNIKLPMISEYINNRDSVINKLMIELHKNKVEVKKVICAVINGSQMIYDNETLKQFSDESIEIFIRLHKVYPHLYQMAKRDNINGSFVSLLNQNIEANIMRIIVSFLKSKDIEVATIIHDGCLVSTFDNVDEILLECNEYVKSNYYGFEIQLIHKVPDSQKFLELENEDIQMTELKLSQMFVEYSIKCKQYFLFVENMWYYCNEKTNMIWVPDTIKFLHEQMTSSLFVEFCKETTGEQFDFARKLCNVVGTKNILYFLKIEFTKSINFQFNQNNDLISFKNGVYDLKTQVFRGHLHSDYHSMSIEYNYECTTDFTNQLKFMDSLFENDETRDYVLKILATNLIGKRVFEEFFVFSGQGSNGKSTLLDIMKNTIGCYSSEISPNFFCEKPQNSTCANPEVHSARFSRGLYMAEPEEKSTFNSSKIKQYTAKSIKSRALHMAPVEWQILFTIIFACNNIPKFDDNTPAFKRRVRLVLFPFSFKDKSECVRENHRLKQQFNFDDNFYNGFMNLLIVYYYKYIKDCNNDNLLPIPMKVKEYTQNYFDDNDTLGCIIKDTFEITYKDTDRLTKAEAYRIYKGNCPDNKYNVSPKTFYDYLQTNLDLTVYKSNGLMTFRGIRFKLDLNLEDIIDDDL